MDFKIARNSMVENQLKPNQITDQRIHKIFNLIKKEKFLKEDIQNLSYIDSDINLSKHRGYLKTLQIARLIQYSKINNKDKVLHIGGLTGYVTTILSKLSKHVVVTEDDQILFDELKKNISKHNLFNVEIFNRDLELGYLEKSPYDLIFIDCPLYDLPINILNQLQPTSGRLIMIEKKDENIGKGVLITKEKENFNKRILFDSFSQFTLYKHNKGFVF